MKVKLAVALSMVCAASAIAKQSAPGSASPSNPDMPMIRVSTQFVVMDALVENKNTGQPIGSLKAKDFLLAEDEVPQNISYFTHDQLPLSVVFLFDLTETVQPVLEPLAEGARDRISLLSRSAKAS
ncbi:MAG TPA: hypothetical protein VGI45_02465 [Terracidiphilus sp.]